MAKRSDDGGAHAAVMILLCVGCCLSALVILTVILTEMKIIGMQTANAEADIVASAAVQGQFVLVDEAVYDSSGGVMETASIYRDGLQNSTNKSGSYSASGEVMMSVAVGNGGVPWSMLFIPLFILEFVLAIITTATVLQLVCHARTDHDMQVPEHPGHLHRSLTSPTTGDMN